MILRQVCVFGNGACDKRGSEDFDVGVTSDWADPLTARPTPGKQDGDPLNTPAEPQSGGIFAMAWCVANAQRLFADCQPSGHRNPNRYTTQQHGRKEAKRREGKSWGQQKTSALSGPTSLPSVEPRPPTRGVGICRCITRPSPVPYAIRPLICVEKLSLETNSTVGIASNTGQHGCAGNGLASPLALPTWIATVTTIQDNTARLVSHTVHPIAAISTPTSLSRLTSLYS